MNTLNRDSADTIAPKPVEWLWPGRVAIGKQTMIAGEAGLGKSQAVLDMAARVTTGGHWPCGEGKTPLGNVIILPSRQVSGAYTESSDRRRSGRSSISDQTSIGSKPCSDRSG